VVPGGGKGDPADGALLALVAEATTKEVPAAFGELALSQAIEAWIQAVFACNQYIDAQAPWALRKTDPERMAAVLATLCLAIRDLAIAIQPVIPDASARLLDQLGIPVDARDFDGLGAGPNFTLAAPSPIFPKLDMPADD